MKKTVIHVPAGGIKRKVPYTEPDTPFHRFLRYATVTGAVLCYLICVCSWSLGKGFHHMNGAQFFLGIFLVLLVPLLADTHIRPGTSRTPLLLGLLILILPYGLLVVFVLSLLLLFHQMAASLQKPQK